MKKESLSFEKMPLIVLIFLVFIMNTGFCIHWEDEDVWVRDSGGFRSLQKGNEDGNVSLDSVLF